MSTEIVNVSDRQKILWHLKVKSSAWKGVRYLSMISEKVSFIKWNDILIFFFFLPTSRGFGTRSPTKLQMLFCNIPSKMGHCCCFQDIDIRNMEGLPSRSKIHHGIHAFFTQRQIALGLKLPPEVRRPNVSGG